MTLLKPIRRSTPRQQWRHGLRSRSLPMSRSSIRSQTGGSIRLGGIVGRTPHPSRPEQALNGGPQMVEISRDGKRVYFTNSLYTPWDDQFYPDGVRGWMAKINVRPEGGMELDEEFFLRSDGMRLHQVRLEGGDASSDSYCYA
jgi:selenium-binding protein 1